MPLATPFCSPWSPDHQPLGIVISIHLPVTHTLILLLERKLHDRDSRLFSNRSSLLRFGWPHHSEPDRVKRMREATCLGQLKGAGAGREANGEYFTCLWGLCFSKISFHHCNTLNVGIYCSHFTERNLKLRKIAQDQEAPALEGGPPRTASYSGSPLPATGYGAWRMAARFLP